MQEDTFLRFLKFFGGKFLFQKIHLFISQLGKIIQIIIDPMGIRFILSTIKHNDAGISPVERTVCFISYIVVMVT